MSIRAEIIAHRKYCRPTETGVETWEEVCERMVQHQRWLWSRAMHGHLLSEKQEAELQEFKQLLLCKKASVSGRSLWLGGTALAKERESSQFNCSFTKLETVYDAVDVFWLLLQGCGVGFKPVRGTLNGFFKPIKNIKLIRSIKTAGERGAEDNVEKIDKRSRTWTIIIGDSAEAWAKSLGKLLAGKYNVDTLVLDFSEIRCQGERLKGYGWVSSGDIQLAKAYEAIALLMSRKAGTLLRALDIMDIVNHLGTVLSSRRSAQICLLDSEDIEADSFIKAKKDYWLVGNTQRSQSNNSLLFWKKPTRAEFERIFALMVESGGSEPAFINAEGATRRAPFFAGVNPCGEILLSNKSFCNLTEIDIAKFKGDNEGLLRAVYLMGRANYRQTCVNLKDGILQEAWHLNNEFLRLCGVGLTGIALREDLIGYDYRQLERSATYACYSMADELQLQRPKNCTTIKPSGTLSKIMDTTEGLHKPLGKYIFNNIVFGKGDELLPALREANYTIFDHPSDVTSCLVTFPVCWEGIDFTHKAGVEVNLESAVTQLNRYKMLQENYTQQNSSNTISYDVSEVSAIIDWFMQNWDSYVGLAFLFRADPTMRAKELGYAYLPQEVVTKAEYFAYVSSLKAIDSSVQSTLDIDSGEECVGGACPIK